MKKNAKRIADYIPIVDFIADFMGIHCEVALHDLSDPDASVVAIRNGHLSGRRVGSPATDLALKIMQDRELISRSDYLANYKAINGSGKVFRSSSFFIKDEAGRMIGMLCVNLCIDSLLEFKNFFDLFTRFADTSSLKCFDEQCSEAETAYESGNGQVSIETLHGSVEKIIDSSVAASLKKLGLVADHMTNDEKMRFFTELYHDGIFLIKGGVAEVARRVHVSEPTVYRYLSKIRSESEYL